MLFDFLKYVQPTNYFSLLKEDKSSVFPIPDNLPVEIQNLLVKDNDYNSLNAKIYDLSWQAIQKGYIGNKKNIVKIEKLPIVDEYRFIKKYFSILWAYYTLFVRLLTFHNPLKELNAFFKTKKVNRINIYKNPIKQADWSGFKSELLIEQPKLSIIIPTLNRYEYLKDVLFDLEQQEYANFDVIVVDQSDPFQEGFYSEYNLEINLIHQKEKALWLARNLAIKTSNADYLLLFDDDSRVSTNWISNHLKCLDFFKADISSGTSISVVGAKVPENYAYFKLSDQLDTGNVLIKRDVFKTIGLFDRQFEKQRMGDGEFGLRSHLHGFLNVSNPYAQRLHLKVGTGGLRQMGSWDGFRPKKWFAPRPVPSVLYLFRKYFGGNATKYGLLKAVPPSLISYKNKGNVKMMLFGYILTIVLFPLVLFQIVRSWRLASIKLKEGAKIEKL